MSLLKKTKYSYIPQNNWGHTRTFLEWILLSKLHFKDSSQFQPTPTDIDQIYGNTTLECTKYGVMHKIMIKGHLYETCFFF